VSDSGEGRWTLQAAIDESIPAPVISAALFTRFGSRGEADCDSAWKKDPLGGVIGVQKGPLC
jgi:6-phosphogluconate dehydrogenase (decarboxylating)